PLANTQPHCFPFPLLVSDPTETPNAQIDSTALQSSQTLPTTVLREDEQPPASKSTTHSLTRSKPHHCSHCGKSFISPSYLLRHQAAHTQERPFVCTAPGCSKA